MKKSFLLLALTLLLAACTGAEQIDLESVSSAGGVEATPTETVAVQPTETPAEESKSEETILEPEVEQEASQLGTGGFTSECTLVSSLPDPPQEYAELFGVTEDDWVKGPEDATLTLIEYGDFQ